MSNSLHLVAGGSDDNGSGAFCGYWEGFDSKSVTYAYFRYPQFFLF